MPSPDSFHDLLGQDTPVGNDGDIPGFAQPVSQTEIEELLFGDGPAAERLERLNALRQQLAEMESPDLGDDDPLALIGEIDEAIARLGGDASRDIDLEMDAATLADDPTAHRETLSPDSDELEALEADDEESLSELDEPLDETEWVDGDGFDPAKGVQ